MQTVPAVKKLLAAITNDDDAAAEAAVALLTAADEPHLLQLLQEGSPDQRWWAARALASCGTANSSAPLFALTTATSAELRSVAAMAIGALVQRLAVDHQQAHLTHLTPLLNDGDGMVRQVAADALAQCGNMAIPVLVDVLRYSSEQGARSRAAYALGKIGTMEAAPALYRCLNDQNYLVHTYAHEALDKLGLLENVLMMP